MRRKIKKVAKGDTALAVATWEEGKPYPGQVGIYK